MKLIFPMLVCLLPMAAALAADQVKPVRAEIKPLNGAPAIFVDGNPIFGMGFVRSMNVADKYITEMAGAEVHVFMDDFGFGNHVEGKYDFTGMERSIEHFLSLDPDAYFIPRLGITAPKWWQEKYPEERCTFADGSVGPQSFASERWREDMARDLTALIKHIRNSKYADRVLGFLICSGYSAEWQAWGLWDQQVGDFSEPSVKAFKKWLHAKYKTNEALQAAWKDSSITFDTVTIPTVEERQQSSMMNFRDPAKDGMRVTDFYQYYSDTAADAICHFARVFKEASDGQMLAGFFYGYLNQHGRLQQECQHNAVTKVMNSPHIDFFASPAAYPARGVAGTSNFMTMAESILLHNKLHYNESDIRTFLTPPDAHPGRCNTPEETVAVLQREMGHVLSRAASNWWFDMTGGWFSDERLLEPIKQMNTEAEASLTRPRTGNAEIAVIYDDRSFTVCRPGALADHSAVFPVMEWPRVGAPQDHYLLSDISHPDLPRYKVYVFVNAYQLSDEQIEATHARLKRDRATAVWIYAPGYVTEDGLSTERMKHLTGINIVCEPKELSTKIRINPAHKLTAKESWKETIGAPGKHGPVFFADDEKADVVGVLDALDKPGFVTKQMNDWTSVFYASPTLTVEALRAIADYSGVHIYSRTNDCFYGNRGIITLHAAESGEKLIALPKKADVFDIMTGEKLVSDTDVIRLNLEAGRTSLLKLQ